MKNKKNSLTSPLIEILRYGISPQFCYYVSDLFGPSRQAATGMKTVQVFIRLRRQEQIADVDKAIGGFSSMRIK
jgi:hypothetical protein